MRAVVQRVSRARVEVAGEVVGEIDRGLAILVGVTHDDGPGDVEAMAGKVVGLRIFTDQEGKMNRSVAEVGGAVLLVSQFTLYGEVVRGRRPSFTAAAGPGQAEGLYRALAAGIERRGIEVATGRFGAMMDVHLTNQGPVTILLETRNGRIVQV